MASICNRCRIGTPKWVRYADGTGQMWEDGKGLPYYVFVCNHCGAEHKIPVSRDWDREHPTVVKQLGPAKGAAYRDKYVDSFGLWVPASGEA